MRLVIGKCTLQRAETGKMRLCSEVALGRKSWNLFFEVDKEYEDALCAERADAFLITLLPLAMMAAREYPDLEICAESSVSRKLYHQLVNYYIPILSRNVSYYRPVKIQAETDSAPLPCRHAVGTGISGGVDSSYTIAKYACPDAGSYRLTHGIFFNAGIYGGYDSPAEKSLEAKAEAIARDAGIGYLCVKTNTVLELYKGAHAPIVPFVFMGAVLGLQKLFSVYYYSSGYSSDEIHFADEDAAGYDWLSAECFSNERLQFYLSGMEASRMQKLEYMKDVSFVRKYLTVCLKADQENGNCGRCAKCTRTMAELEALGCLDGFRGVFDVDAFRNDPAYYWGFVLLKGRRDHFCADILEKYRASGRKLPRAAYAGALKKWIKRGFTTENKARIKVEEVVADEIREL